MTNFHIAPDTEDIRMKFLVKQMDYINELVKTPGFADFYKSYKGQDIDVLNNKFKILHQMVEEGKIKDENSKKKANIQMICCCLAIEDELKELIALKIKEVEEGVIEK